MADYFKFNGQNTEKFGMHVAKRPNQNAPKRRQTKVQIPGRNGVLHLEDDGYENITVTYDAWFRGDLTTPEQAHAVKGWLLGAAGYCRLEDKYDPGHFRLAAFDGPMDIADVLGRYGKCKIKFDCDPRAFRKDGEFPIALENGQSIYNPTDFACKPLIHVIGTEPGTMTVAGVTVEVKAFGQPVIVLDCENENAYAWGDVATSYNASIYAPEFPVLLPGENRVHFDGGIIGLQIIPRWWDL